MFTFDAEIAPEKLQVRRTKNYDQFLSIKGNRAVKMGHVNSLITMINRYNLLPQFVGVVTKDGYLIDGQHRLEAAKTNKLWFYFTIIPESVDDIIVSLVNATQLKWTVDNYVDFFADRGSQQYIWLRDLHKEHGVSCSGLIALFKGTASIKMLKKGTLSFYSTNDEKEYLLALLEGYLATKSLLEKHVWGDMDFIRALRVIFQQINSEELAVTIEKWGKIIPSQNHHTDYLRLFEEIVNKGKHGNNRIRFF